MNVCQRFLLVFDGESVDDPLPRSPAGLSSGKREQRDVVAVTLGGHFVIKRARGLAELRKQISLSAGAVRHSRIGGSLVGVRIESADRTEKYLPVHAESAIGH